MAKYQIKAKCGHIIEERLFGKSSDREKRIKWIEENKYCLKCFQLENHDNTELPHIKVKVINQDKYEVIFHGNTFWMKDTLKEWGFTFGKFSLGEGIEGMLGMKLSAGWSRIHDLDEVVAALEFFKNEGYKISIDVGLSVLFSSVIEGDKEKFTEVKNIGLKKMKTKFQQYLLGEKQIWLNDSLTEFDLFQHGIDVKILIKTDIEISVDLEKYRKFAPAFLDGFSFYQFACERFYKMSQGGKKNREAKSKAGKIGGKVGGKIGGKAKVKKGFAMSGKGGRKPLSNPSPSTLAKRKSRAKQKAD